MSQQVRIVHLATRLIFAGTGHVVASLVRGMPSPRYRSIIWCLEEADALGLALRAEGHEVVELGKRWRWDVRLFVRIATLLRKERIDILHCHDELGWFYGTIGARLAGMPQVLVTMHGRRPDISTRHLFEQKALAALTMTIVNVSSYLRQQIIDELGVAPPKAALIRNGVTLASRPSSDARARARALLDVSDDAQVVGCVGRLDTIKNLDLLIEAIADACHAVPRLRLMLIGEGPCLEHLNRKVADLRLNEVVVFVGLRKDVAELLPGLDLYVCSSDYEGVSLSILEAMVAELAVVATAVGGNTEIICHNETGILVQPRNRQAMANAVIALFTDEAKRQSLGVKARHAIEKNFNMDRMISDYDCLYQSMLPDSRIGGRTVC